MLGLEEPALVLKVLTFLILVPLMPTLPGQEEVVSAALVKGYQQTRAEIPPFKADLILHQFFLQWKGLRYELHERVEEVADVFYANSRRKKKACSGVSL